MDGQGLEGGLGVRRGCHLIGLGLGCGARLADSGGMMGASWRARFFFCKVLFHRKNGLQFETVRRLVGRGRWVESGGNDRFCLAYRVDWGETG